MVKYTCSVKWSFRDLVPSQNIDFHLHFTAQPAFTCSKLAIETLEQGVKYLQS